MKRALLCLALSSAPALVRSASSSCSSSGAPPTLRSLLSFRALAGSNSSAPQAITPSSTSGKAVLLVNTASLCGYTPQLAQLQELHSSFEAKGLLVVAVPSNDFGAQEPGDAAAIRSLYEGTYKASFFIAEKTAVVGGEAHPFYLHLQKALGDAGAPSWNFVSPCRGAELARRAAGARQLLSRLSLHVSLSLFSLLSLCRPST